MRSTPVLLVVFVVVLNRSLELATGWPEAIVLPVVGLAGTALMDRLILPESARLPVRSWALNVVVAVMVGVLVGLVVR